MIILATATPNRQYEHWINFRNMEIRAVLSDAGSVQYYEIQPGRLYVLSEQTVNSLFVMDMGVHDRPFVREGNEDFYAVLHRDNNIKYKQRYEELIQLNRPLVRTKLKPQNDE